MKLEEIKALSDRELDARLAILDGWVYDGWANEWNHYQGSLRACRVRPPRFCKSLDTIAPLEAKALEKVGRRRWGCALVGLVAGDVWEEFTVEDLTLFINATPRQRAEAVLFVYREDA